MSVSITEILARTSEEEVATLVGEALDATKIPAGSQARIRLYEKAKQVWNVGLNTLPIINITAQDPFDVAEMYNRLNLTGTKVKETDTLLVYCLSNTLTI